MQISSSEYLGKKIDIHLYAIVSKTNFTCGKWKNITNIRVYKLVYKLVYTFFFNILKSKKCNSHEPHFFSYFRTHCDDALWIISSPKVQIFCNNWPSLKAQLINLMPRKIAIRYLMNDELGKCCLNHKYKLKTKCPPIFLWVGQIGTSKPRAWLYQHDSLWAKKRKESPSYSFFFCFL